MPVGALEAQLHARGLTLDLTGAPPEMTVGDWLARGAPGSRDRWRDPVDQLLSGFEATLASGGRLRVHPAPRRAVGPDLTALFVGAGDRFGRIDGVFLRVHPRGVARPEAPPFRLDRDPPVSPGEEALVDRLSKTVRDET
jgi:alkyldihydroxyacetonephosphate synthase